MNKNNIVDIVCAEKKFNSAFFCSDTLTQCFTVVIYLMVLAIYNPEPVTCSAEVGTRVLYEYWGTRELCKVVRGPIWGWSSETIVCLALSWD